MLTKGRTVVTLVIVAVVVIAIFAAHRYVTGYEQQINNLELAKAYGRALDAYYHEHATYPAALPAVYSYLSRESNAHPGLDVWGHSFFYQSHGASFLLVSFGRDGKRESGDYWQYRTLPTTPPGRICGEPDADQVMSELGFHQACYK